MIAASGSEGMGYQVPAVRVWDGTVDAVTVFGSQLTGPSYRAHMTIYMTLTGVFRVLFG
jgi:hypothetical protein